MNDAPTPPLRIAFGGRMQVGKTTAALHLVERHGFVRFALADPIKDIAGRDFGWDGAKDARGRQLLQEVGDVGRNYDPEIWLDRLAARIAAREDPRVVVDDLRMAREAEFLERLGFVTVRVLRPPAEAPADAPADARRGHATETGLYGVHLDLELDNAGTFEDLYGRLDALVTELEEGGGPAVGGRKTERPRPETGPSALGQEETQA